MFCKFLNSSHFISPVTKNILLEVSNAKIQQAGNQLIEDLNFRWNKGENWAIIGESGKELTAFLEALRGNTVISTGTVHHPFAEEYALQKNSAGEIHSFRDLIAYVSQRYELKNRSNQQNFYFQQRFNSSESDQTLTVSEYLENAYNTTPGFWTVEKATEILNLRHLRNQSLLKLSNGETRRLVLALGLMKQPVVYLMDQPMTGLDLRTREEFGEIIKKMIEAGVNILITCSGDEIPDGITHVAKLNSMGIAEIWTIKSFPHLEHRRSSHQWDWTLLKKLLPKNQSLNYPLVQLENVNIIYGQKQILKNINWQIESGDRWLLKGQNGSGKSTLISLLIGENPQAYAQNITLFGRKRGSGESIWDVKRPTGFVAPELSRYFPSNQTCEKVILSGYSDTMGLFKKATSDQKSKADQWLSLFELTEVKDHPISRLSVAQQRWTLLARAMIKEPILLILDEASQGLDDSQRALYKATLEKICEHSSITLIFVSHYLEDIPCQVNKIMDLGS